jgi:hypothetical protein
MPQLAHINIGTMRGPIDSEVMAEFRKQIAHFNSLADESAGFIWRLKTERGDTGDIDAFDNPRIFITMSVWESFEHLFEFTYRSEHVDIFRRRRNWIERGTSRLALWWVLSGHRPTVEEAKERLERMARDGPTSLAFNFKRRYPPPPMAEQRRTL